MEDLTQRLPHDLLADVLRRLQKTSTCSLAASRCVCKAWRTVVDTHRLLADLLPHSLTGIFFHLNGEMLPRHFPVAASAVNIAHFDYLDTCDTTEYVEVMQHCNGLLLLVAYDGDYEPEGAWVLNPATQQWTHLPTPPPMCTPGMEDMDDVDDDYIDCHDQYLVFNPTVSPHYEVFLVKYVPFLPWPASSQLVDLHIQEREWPPSTFVLLVYSSKTNRWEKRPFVREGKAAGTIDDMLQARTSDHRFAAYWQEALYFHQRGLFMRVNLSSNKYQLIKPPKGFREYHVEHHFGKSKNGVYCALLDALGLRIWYLDETGDQTKWVLKCDSNLQHLLADFSREHNDRPSKVQCGNFDEDGRTKALVGEDLIFDTDSAGSTKDGAEQSDIKYSLIGFHPNEEIVFLHTQLNRVMTYHFNSSEIQDLGCLPVETQSQIGLCFPYTPCLMGEFSNNK